jgi:hypothetical protein
MTILSQIRTGERQPRTIDRASSVKTLVAALRETERTLRENIQLEEERTSLRDLNNPCYSTLARSMRARADNLHTTIAMLDGTPSAA